MRRGVKEHTFSRIVMFDEIEAACHRARSEGIENITICGVGKFPSIWLQKFREHGITVDSYIDTNSCWQGQKIHGIPVESPEDISTCKIHSSRSLFLTGLASSAETSYWSDHFSKRGSERHRKIEIRSSSRQSLTS